MQFRLTRTAFAALLAVSAVAPAAAADELPSFDARVWRPATDPRAQLVLQPTTTPGAGVFSTAAWASYAYRPIALRDPSAGGVVLRPVSERVTLDLTANLGIGERSAIGVAVPLASHQSGSSGLPSSASSVDRVPNTALGDLMLVGKHSLVGNPNGGFG